MSSLLILAALGAAAISIFFVTQATVGVWMIAGAVLCAALARIAQAADHHKKLIGELKRQEETKIESKTITATESRTTSAQAFD